MSKNKKQKTKSNLSKVLITIGLILGFIACLILINIALDKHEESKLRNEIESINKILDAKTLDEDKLNKKLDKIVTKNDYAKIEKAYKAFLKDDLITLNELKDYFNGDGKKVYQMLNIENIKEDGKSFDNSKATLEANKKTLTKLKEDYNSYFEEKKLMSYLDTKDLKEYYINYYKNQIVKGLKETKEEKNLADEIDKTLKDIDNISKAIDFLKDHSSSWNIKKNEINWSDEDLMNQYVAIVGEIS